jgi:hypothetical protein
VSSKQDCAAIVDALNDVAPDTFDEGDHGPWTFSKLASKAGRWTLVFEAGGQPGSVSFPFDGHCLDEDGTMATDWYESGAVPALHAWETAVESAEEPAQAEEGIEVKVDEDGSVQLHLSAEALARALSDS